MLLNSGQSNVEHSIELSSGSAVASLLVIGRSWSHEERAYSTSSQTSCDILREHRFATPR